MAKFCMPRRSNDDCRKLAVEKQVPLQQVINEALRTYE